MVLLYIAQKKNLGEFRSPLFNMLPLKAFLKQWQKESWSDKKRCLKITSCLFDKLEHTSSLNHPQLTHFDVILPGDEFQGMLSDV